MKEINSKFSSRYVSEPYDTWADILLAFITYKLPIRRATFSSRRGEFTIKILYINNSSTWIKNINKYYQVHTYMTSTFISNNYFILYSNYNNNTNGDNSTTTTSTSRTTRRQLTPTTTMQRHQQQKQYACGTILRALNDKHSRV